MIGFAPSAQGAFGIVRFDGETTAGEGGGAYTQAGGHPYAATTEFALTETTDSEGRAIPEEAARNVQVVLPAGFVANPLITPTRCTEAQLTFGTEVTISGKCPAASQVGTIEVNIGGEFFLLPLFNMVPGPNEPAELAARFLTTDFHIHTRVGIVGGEYRVLAELRNSSNSLPVIASEVTLWGTPADATHDGLRGECLQFIGPTGGLCHTDAPPIPFVTMPTACTPPGVGLETALSIESWMGSKASASFMSHLPDEPQAEVGPTGCSNVPFTPTFALQPSTTSADSPSGLHVDLIVPQAGLEVVGGTAASHLKKVVVTLPKGMSVNPSSANGLGACSPAQIGLGSDAEPSCPDSSKIGSLEVDTPLLSEPVGGSVYLAKQKDNPFGGLLAVYIVAKGPGVLVKLSGRVEARPDGQLVATFDDNPQVPFSAMHLDFFGGPRAALRMPPACGTYTTDVELVPWSGKPPVHSSSSFSVASGPNGGRCPDRDFAPELNAGTTNPVAGHYSPFVLQLTRNDGEQELSGLSLSLPRGLVGKLAGVSYCPEGALASIPDIEGTGAAEVAVPACPAASQIGTVVAGAGAGPSPIFVDTGRVFLAGSYKGAPLSAVIVAPAVTGPFDLGNVVVRSALRVDESTAQVTAVSDPIPTILHGIPLDLRDVRVSLSRPRFALNPTSCAQKSFAGTASSAAGLTAPLEERFQVGSCASLGFEPRLRLSLTGATHRGAHPRLKAVLTARKGDANIRRAAVALPRSEFLDQSHIGTVCTRVQFAASQCPVASIYGRAKVTTPLLDRPLKGPVYLRSSSHTLPDLVADLRGQIHIALAGRIDQVRGGIRNTFETVPDAPVTRFVLQMRGGKKGLLQNSRNICKEPGRATVKLDGQNGKFEDLRLALKNSCQKGAEKSPRGVDRR
jgi:hypothetical protein